MSNFIDDITDLPDGKEDIRPLVGLAKNSYTAAEWNTICQALLDTRGAITNLQGLTAPVIGGVAADLSTPIAIYSEFGAVDLATVSTGYIRDARDVTITINGSCRCTSPLDDSTFDILVKVDGTPQMGRTLRVSTGSDNQQVWSATSYATLMGSGSSTIILYAVRTAGTGTLTFNPENFAELTFMG